MLIREVRPEEKSLYNQVVTHPLQSWEWGDFRQETGVEVVRIGEFDQTGKILNGFQLTFHPIPKLPFTIGYMPRSVIPKPEVMGALKQLAQQKNAIFIKMEPNKFEPAPEKKDTAPNPNSQNQKITQYLLDNGCFFGKPLFTQYSFVLDITKTEDQLSALMKQKTRYNTNLAYKKGVRIIQDNSSEAFEEYLHLTFNETTKRQKFYAHDRNYHLQMWKHMHKNGIAHLFKAVFQGQTLVTWIVFIFNNVLYYPYGASSSQHRNLMPSNLMMWEVIKFGRAHGCQYFDMWGALGPEPDPTNGWIGFHKFKQGYGATLMQFPGTFDLIVDPPKYKLYLIADNIRWKLLNLKSMLPF